MTEAPPPPPPPGEEPPAVAGGRYAALALALACLGSLAVSVFFTRQVTRLREADYVSEQLLPLCTTIAALLDACDEFPAAAAAALKSLEHSSPFRNTWITVFSEAGDVWADSHTPTTGRLPMPPCPSQRTAFQLAKEAADGHTVVKRRVGHCALSGATADVSLAAKMTSKKLLLVVQSCGTAAA